MVMGLLLRATAGKNTPRMRLCQRGSQLRIWERENLKQGVVLRAQDGRQEDVAVCAEAAERSHEMKTEM